MAMHTSEADPGIEKGGGAYLGQFRGLFKEFGAKTGGRATPAPPSRSAPVAYMPSCELLTSVRVTVCALV